MSAVAEATGQALAELATFENAIGKLADAGTCWRMAVQEYAQWQQAKPGQKVAAIKRIMAVSNDLTGKGHSCSSAEAIVETDEQYKAFLSQGTTLLLLTMQLETAYTVAKFRVQYVVGGQL